MLVGCEFQREGSRWGFAVLPQKTDRQTAPESPWCACAHQEIADIGDKVVLFVDFGDQWKPSPRRNQRYSLGGAIAGNVWPDQRQHDPEAEQYEVGTETSN